MRNWCEGKSNVVGKFRLKAGAVTIGKSAPSTSSDIYYSQVSVRDGDLSKRNRNIHRQVEEKPQGTRVQTASALPSRTFLNGLPDELIKCMSLPKSSECPW